MAIDSETAARPGLDRTRIVTTALSFIDSSGVSALTMRRLGSLMGVEAMSLYRYVVSREALLDAVVDRVMSELDADLADRVDQAYGGPAERWEDEVARLAHAVRRVSVAHPRAFSLVATRPTAAPWLRPPLRTPAQVEHLLAVLIAAGFSEADALQAYRALSGFLLGHLLLEVGPSGDVPVGSVAALDGHLKPFPVLSRLAPELEGSDADADFETGLVLLVDRLRTLRDA